MTGPINTNDVNGIFSDDEMITNSHRRSLKVHPHMAAAAAVQKVAGNLFILQNNLA